MGNLISEYSIIEKDINLIVEFLESKKNEVGYKNIYKGIATLLSPLVENPDILFLGINSGSGAWVELNQQKGTNHTPLRMLGHDDSFIKHQNDWFKPNTARGSWGKGKENKAFEWYQRDKPMNNQFPVNMIDLLYNIAEKKHPEIKTNDIEEPLWTEDIKNNVLYTNLYPVITDDVNDLNKIHKLLAKENSLQKLFSSENKKLNEWDIRLFFIRYIDKLVELINPKVIVCLGATAFNDFTYSKSKDKNKIFSTVKNDRHVIGFSRQGNWSGLIPKISEELSKHIM